MSPVESEHFYCVAAGEAKMRPSRPVGENKSNELVFNVSKSVFSIVSSPDPLAPKLV